MIMDIVTICKKSQYYKHIVHQLKDIVTPRPQCKADMYITSKSGQRRIRQSTSGWYFLNRYKDGSEQWIPLKILKESNPIELAEFTATTGISEPALA